MRFIQHHSGYGVNSDVECNVKETIFGEFGIVGIDQGNKYRN